MRFPTMWYVQPAKAQTSLRIRTVRSEPSMNIKLLTYIHYLEFLSLKWGCTYLSESTLVKMPHCWKSRVSAQLLCCWWHLKEWTLWNVTMSINWYQVVQNQLVNTGERTNVLLVINSLPLQVVNHCPFLNFNQSGIDRNLHIRVPAKIWKSHWLITRLFIQTHSSGQHSLKINAKI